MMVKREPLITLHENTAVDQSPSFRSVKMEKSKAKANRTLNSDQLQETDPKLRRFDRPRDGRDSREEPVEQSTDDRRKLRSHYRAVQDLINEEKEELCKGDSDTFQKIIKEVDKLHQHVTKPREQVADAETLLEMANTLAASVKAHSKEGFTPSDFVSGLIREFVFTGGARTRKEQVSINWKAIGMLACPIFMKGSGCSTMIGPMNVQLKPRKVMAPRRRNKPTERAAKPEQLEDNSAGEKTDTDKNMATMFDILRRRKSVLLEHLILNRFSFAQTVENLFALSFLVKDGRAQIAVDDNGKHRVSPRNAPLAELVYTGEVVYDHFVFRFDYKDWKLMVDSVPRGEELMPHRRQMSILLSQEDEVPVFSQIAVPTTPLKL